MRKIIFFTLLFTANRIFAQSYTTQTQSKDSIEVFYGDKLPKGYTWAIVDGEKHLLDDMVYYSIAFEPRKVVCEGKYPNIRYYIVKREKEGLTNL